MSAVLGVSAYYHDAAAALVIDGRLVAANQEERFTRLKNDASPPLHAARACLEAGGITAGDLDAVVFYESPYAKIERVLVWGLQTFPRSVRQFPRAMGAQLGRKLWVLDQLAEGFSVPRNRVSHVGHHHSHAASAFFLSPFERAAVLTVDGVGEADTTGIWLGEGSEVTRLVGLQHPHSLGLLYAGLTAWMGFAVNEGEYKVMGLAAFGQPRFRLEFQKLIQLGADGSFTLGLPYFGWMVDPDRGFGPELERLIGPRRPMGKPWDLSDPDDQHYADVAATLQQVTEEALLGLAREARRRTEADALCLAGGVALNAVANARLAAESGFAQIFAQPAAGDAGGAVGAAILGALERGDPRPDALEHVALGVRPRVQRGLEMATHLGLKAERVSDPAEAVAEALSRDRIVAVCTGPMEFGPRALGQRSLLANPRTVDSRERMNRAVKGREPFRPFAPAVLADATSTWFGGEPDLMTPFMTRVLPVTSDDLPAVTHADGTARVQTVTGGLLADVLGAMDRHTGSPVVLNTSLNGPGEPICATETDALGFFLRHPIHALLLDDVWVTRP